jgi:hypothetical protein
VQDHPEAEQCEHGDRDVVGIAADEVPECVAEQQADDGIAISKLDITRLTRRRALAGKPRIPSAAATANVSSPSGTMSRISFSTEA